MMEISLTYEQAFKELEQISLSIQNETISVDDLAKKVKRASDLITFCQTKLRSTEAEVNKVIAQMEQTSKGNK